MTNKLRIKAFPRRDWSYGLEFWCVNCGKWHTHGEGSGHRQPHCDNNLYPTDYELVQLSIKELKEFKKSIIEELDRRQNK